MEIQINCALLPLNETVELLMKLIFGRPEFIKCNKGYNGGIHHYRAHSYEHVVYLI